MYSLILPPLYLHNTLTVIGLYKGLVQCEPSLAHIRPLSLNFEALDRPRGGGGGTSIIYAYWVRAARETPIFSPEFPFRSISFSQNYPKKIRSGASPLYIYLAEYAVKETIIFNFYFYFNPFMADFAVPETIIFKISLISTRSSPPTAGSALLRSAVPRVSSLPERQPDASWQFRRLACMFTLKTDLVVPEPRIFKLKTAQARSGAPHFHAQPGACSGALANCSHFAAAHTYQHLRWVPPLPPAWSTCQTAECLAAVHGIISGSTTL